MIQTGFEIRAASLLAIAAFGYLAVPRRELWALAAFTALVLTWPVLGVSAPAIVATRSSVVEGERMGLYNAASAVGTLMLFWWGGKLGSGPKTEGGRAMRFMMPHSMFELHVDRRRTA